VQYQYWLDMGCPQNDLRGRRLRRDCWRGSPGLCYAQPYTAQGLSQLLAYTTIFIICILQGWFFTETAIIAVGSNVTDTTNHSVATTLLSRNQFSNVTLILPGGQRQVLPDGVYEFPGDTAITFGVDDAVIALQPSTGSTFHLISGLRTGNWSIIGPDKGSVTARAITLYIDHGVKPQVCVCLQRDGSRLSSSLRLQVSDYSYTIYPAAVEAGLAPVITNTPSVQVATILMDPTNGIPAPYSMAIFWPHAVYPLTTTTSDGAGYSLTLTTTGPGLLIFRESGSATTISFSNPDQPGFSVNVTVSRVLSGPGCSTGQDPTTTVFSFHLPSDKNYVGQTVSISCT
jgi:hypothetical protein